MRLNRIGAVAALLLSCLWVNAQVTVTGIVKDKTDNQPLPMVSVRMLVAKDSSYVAGVSSNMNGAFTLNASKPGNYLLAFSFLGYNTQYVPVRTSAATPKRDVGVILMESGSILLEEAVVMGKKAEVVVKEDTIEFNADSYKTQPSAVVEDLIKKLPGVEVDSDGKITAGGKEVTKILIDGKEFFGDDPKVATKNLPVEMVEKLQVIDRKSDLARLTGVDDGEEETVINLTVKKGMKRGWFGNVMGGYGLHNRYEASAMVNNFVGDNQYTILAGSNNTNNMGFTDQGGQRFRRFGGMNGVNTSHNLGGNFNVGKGEEFRVGGDLMYNYAKRDNRRNSERQNLFQDSTSYYHSNTKSIDEGHNVMGNFRLEWKVDSLNTLDFRPRFNVSYNRSTQSSIDSTLAGDPNRTPVNYSRNDTYSKGVYYDLTGELIYNHRFRSKPGRSFSIFARYKFNNTDEDGYSRSFNRIYDLIRRDTTEIDLDQESDDRVWNNTASARITFTEPLGDVKKGNFLTVAYRFNYTGSNSDKYTYDVLPDMTGADSLAFNNDYSNSFRNTKLQHRVQVGYKKVQPKYTADVGLAFEPLTSESKNLLKSEGSIPRYTVFNMAPYLRYRYKVGKQRSIRIDYRGRTDQPTMAQMQPVADISNPLKVTIGNANLNPAFRNTLRARFNDYDEKSQRSMMASLNANYTFNSIVSKTTSSAAGDTTTYANVNGVWNVAGMYMITTPFRDKRWQLNSFTRLSYDHNIGFNNGIEVETGNFRAIENLGIAFRSTYFDAELRGTYQCMVTNSSIQKSLRTTHTYGGTVNLSGYLPYNITIGTDLNYRGTAGYSAGYDTQQWLWNAQISYQFLKGKNATIMLKYYDILQQRSNVQRTVTGNYIQDVAYNTLPSYGMITFTYRFNTFGGKQPEPSNFSRPYGPPHGGPRGGGRPF